MHSGGTLFKERISWIVSQTCYGSCYQFAGISTCAINMWSLECHQTSQNIPQFTGQGVTLEIGVVDNISMYCIFAYRG